MHLASFFDFGAFARRSNFYRPFELQHKMTYKPPKCKTLHYSSLSDIQSPCEAPQTLMPSIPPNGNSHLACLSAALKSAALMRRLSRAPAFHLFYSQARKKFPSDADVCGERFTFCVQSRFSVEWFPPNDAVTCPLRHHVRARRLFLPLRWRKLRLINSLNVIVYLALWSDCLAAFFYWLLSVGCQI